ALPDPLPSPGRAWREHRAARRGNGLHGHARAAIRAPDRRGARAVRPGAPVPGRLLLRTPDGVARRRSLGLAAQGHAGRVGEGGGHALSRRVAVLLTGVGKRYDIV